MAQTSAPASELNPEAHPSIKGKSVPIKLYLGPRSKNIKFPIDKHLANIVFGYYPHEFPWSIANTEREILVQRDKVT